MGYSGGIDNSIARFGLQDLGHLTSSGNLARGLQHAKGVRKQGQNAGAAKNAGA